MKSQQARSSPTGAPPKPVPTRRDEPDRTFSFRAEAWEGAGGTGPEPAGNSHAPGECQFNLQNRLDFSSAADRLYVCVWPARSLEVTLPTVARVHDTGMNGSPRRRGDRRNGTQATRSPDSRGAKRTTCACHRLVPASRPNRTRYRTSGPRPGGRTRRGSQFPLVAPPLAHTRPIFPSTTSLFLHGQPHASPTQTFVAPTVEVRARMSCDGPDWRKPAAGVDANATSTSSDSKSESDARGTSCWRSSSPSPSLPPTRARDCALAALHWEHDDRARAEGTEEGQAARDRAARRHEKRAEVAASDAAENEAVVDASWHTLATITFAGVLAFRAEQVTAAEAEERERRSCGATMQEWPNIKA